MGQATLDLPDPLQTPAVNAGNTDDLLAQLAGEEIDRLLAEADTGAPPVAPSSAASTQPASKAAEPVTQASAAAADASTGSANANVSSAELNDLLGQLDVAAPAPAAEKGTSPISAAENKNVPFSEAAGTVVNGSEASPAPEEHPVAAELDEDARVSAGRGAFNAPATAAAKAEASDIVMPRVASEGLPIYLRPLEWLNAPLASCPDPVRDTIGKIAILTTVNALSVLAYVLIFRGH